MTHKKELVLAALTQPNFDFATAMLEMAPARDVLARPPADARMGAVLALLYEKDGETHILFAKRPMTMRNHPGQIAFPGGRQDEGETMAETALRETEEEVGIPPRLIEILDTLHPTYIPPSNFFVQPYVGWHEGEPELTAAPDEVEQILQIPLRRFTEPMCKREISVGKNGRFVVPAFCIDQHEIWGATAVILNELVARLRQVGFWSAA